VSAFWWRFLRLDTEVLNLLPRGFDSVEGLKIYNSEFAQTRELTFALLCQPEDVDKLEEFAPKFVENLRAQPWCVRVLAGSPMETPDGVRDLQRIALPLLLNLEPEDFDRTLSLLQPQNIQERLAQLRREIESGSPRPEIELTLDPLGLITPSLKPFAGNAAMETDQPLTSPDSTMRIFPTVTNQPSISAFDCQNLMKQVNAFRVSALDGWDGGKLEVLITGRSAYVAEISLSMRHDIIATVLSSIALVGAVFFIGFRRWLPLLGMGFALLLCCLIGLAAGLLIFHRLNMVTVGFCAILVGLGVDFAILIYGRYQQARNGGDAHRVAVADAVHSPWPCGFLWRLNHRGWFSRPRPKQLFRIYSARRPHRHRNFRGRAFDDDGLFPVRAAEKCSVAQRLDFGFGEKLCASYARPAAVHSRN
jgi:predicted exporter